LNDWGRGDPSDLANYIPQNYYGMDATNDKAAIRNTTMEMIQDSIINAGGSKFLANLASETYAGVDSAVESRLLAIACIALMGPMLGESVAYALSSPASLGARYGEAIALALMGNSAASGKMREAIDNGLDNSHVVMSALSSGIAEVTFEKVSLDKLLSETGSFDRANVWKSIMDMLKSSGSQRLVEGSEEIFTNLADTITDFLINGDMSQLSKDITKYEKQNMSPYEARQKAWSDYVGETLQAGFGGFIGGGGELHYLGSAAFNAAMSPVQRAYDTYQQNRNYQNVGNAVINNQNVDALVREAQNTGNDALMNLANQVAAAQNSDVVKPSRKDEKVFKIAAAVPGEHYTYLYVYMNFEAGKTYDISYEVYPLQNMYGENYKTAIAGNLLYGSDGANTANHIIDPEHNKESGMGWKEVKVSLAIDADYNPTPNDHFEIWGRFFEGAPVEYLVKDIVIKPAK
jgi:hypothetical protein